MRGWLGVMLSIETSNDVCSMSKRITQIDSLQRRHKEAFAGLVCELHPLVDVHLRALLPDGLEQHRRQVPAKRANSSPHPGTANSMTGRQQSKMTTTASIQIILMSHPISLVAPIQVGSPLAEAGQDDDDELAGHVGARGNLQQTQRILHHSARFVACWR